MPRPSLALLFAAAAPAFAAPPPVELTLKEVKAVRWEGGDVHLTCTVVFSNRTGGEVVVKSTCSSAFDAAQAVVRGKDGRELLRQGYWEHQSPFAQAKAYPLAKGETERELTFPVPDFPKGHDTVRVSLVWDLKPGSERGELLLTDVVEAKVEKQK